MSETIPTQRGLGRELWERLDRVTQRERNSAAYRLGHWPIWIAVFYILPGPLTFDLFERGLDPRMALWLLAVLGATGWAALRGRLPGVEPSPYILYFTEDKPNPLYRRICYTAAWCAALSFELLNLSGLAWALLTGQWRLRQIYDAAYYPLIAATVALGLMGLLPRTRRSTRYEGHERRWFYGLVWAVIPADLVLMILWKSLPRGWSYDLIRLGAHLLVLGALLWLAYLGQLPRTRRPRLGEAMID
ncbi:MAG TPA: hypothetical protein VGB99_12845 [Acidobacteriota bacterium]